VQLISKRFPVIPSGGGACPERSRREAAGVEESPAPERWDSSTRGASRPSLRLRSGQAAQNDWLTNCTGRNSWRLALRRDFALGCHSEESWARRRVESRNLAVQARRVPRFRWLPFDPSAPRLCDCPGRSSEWCWPEREKDY